jgi:hypothetical protein
MIELLSYLIFGFFSYFSLVIMVVAAVFYLRRWSNVLVREKDNPSRTVVYEIAMAGIGLGVGPYFWVVPTLSEIKFDVPQFKVSVFTLPAGIGQMKSGDLVRIRGKIELLLGFAGDEFEVTGAGININGQRSKVLTRIQSPSCGLRGTVAEREILTITHYLAHLASGSALSCEDIKLTKLEPQFMSRVLYPVWPPRYFGLSSAELAKSIAG